MDMGQFYSCKCFFVFLWVISFKIFDILRLVSVFIVFKQNENIFVYLLSPYNEESYNEEIKLRVEELTCSVGMQINHIRQELLPQN